MSDTNDRVSAADRRRRYAEPGEDHARLQALIGVWDTVTTRWVDSDRRPIESDGSVEKTWILGGRFVREDLAGVSPDGAPHLGLGFIGFDAVGQRYQGVWMNSGVSAMTHFVGHYDQARNAIVFEGLEPDPTGGAERQFRSMLHLESPVRHRLEQSFRSTDGEWIPAFEILYDRVATPGDPQVWGE